MEDIQVLRTMSAFLSRVRAASLSMFSGKRDFYSSLGYTETLTYEQHRRRWERGDIAGRIVDALPEATWAGDAEIIEDATPDILTPFEQDIKAFLSATNLWSVAYRADVLAGLGTHSILLIGAPGFLHEELPKGKPGDVKYVGCYGEANAKITKYDEDERSERFCMPLEYELVNLTQGGASNSKGTGKKVHWTRVIHIADGALDNVLVGTPRLERVWNRLDDLEKVVGGGSEAFWKTVFQGMQVDVDKDMDLTPEAKDALTEQIDEFEHGMRRVFRTRGVKVSMLGADTSDFSSNAKMLLEIISGASRIPQRILLGSERGELASTQDRDNWHDRVTNRRSQFAAPVVVHPLVDRLLLYGYLRPPKVPYWVVWPKLGMTLAETSGIANTLSKVNTQMGETVVTGADIRDRVLGWDPLQVDDLVRDPALDTADPLKNTDPAVEDDTEDDDVEPPPT